MQLILIDSYLDVYKKTQIYTGLKSAINWHPYSSVIE